MACPQDCALQHQSSRGVLPLYRAPILGRYDHSPRKPVDNVIPVSTYLCTTCKQQWMKIERRGESAAWTQALGDGSFRGT
jgi:hypothetical protein